MYLGGRELFQGVRDRVVQLGGPELSAADVRLILRAYADVATNWLVAPNRMISLPGVGRLVMKYVGARKRFDGLAKQEVLDPPRLRLGIRVSSDFDRETTDEFDRRQGDP